MATYDVTFETMDDTSARGGKRGAASRHFDVEAKSPTQAIEAGYIKLTAMIPQGYFKIDDVQGVKGEVRRDRTSSAMWYTGRRHDDSNDPRWTFRVVMETGPLRLKIYDMKKVQ